MSSSHGWTLKATVSMYTDDAVRMFLPLTGIVYFRGQAMKSRIRISVTGTGWHLRALP